MQIRGPRLKWRDHVSRKRTLKHNTSARCTGLGLSQNQSKPPPRRVAHLNQDLVGESRHEDGLHFDHREVLGLLVAGDARGERRPHPVDRVVVDVGLLHRPLPLVEGLDEVGDLLRDLGPLGEPLVEGQNSRVNPVKARRKIEKTSEMLSCLICNNNLAHATVRKLPRKVSGTEAP